jgi:hypothetical protein
MSILGTFIKQAAEKESYSIDYSADLEGDDFIASAVTTVSDSALIVQSTLCVDTIVKVWIYGGVVGTKYEVTVTTTTNDGRILQDEFYIKLKAY